MLYSALPGKVHQSEDGAGEVAPRAERGRHICDFWGGGWLSEVAVGQAPQIGCERLHPELFIAPKVHCLFGETPGAPVSVMRGGV